MSKATATINGKVIAESETWEVVDGNIYFPPSSVEKSLLSDTTTKTTCPYKGVASYYAVNLDGQETKDVAWYYPHPKSGFEKIEGFVAFYKSKVDVSTS